MKDEVMFRTFLMAAGIAATALIAAPAQSQVTVETRIDRPGFDGPRYRDRPGYEVRRVERRVVRERPRDCRIIEKRRINRFGERVITRSRVCG